MPIYKVKAPDGSIIKIEGPEGATDEQLVQAASAGYKGASQQKAIDPTEGMTTTEKLLAGTGKAFVDLSRGVGQFIPKGLPGHVSREDIEEARKMDAPLMNTTAGKVGNIGGNIAVSLPAAFIPGANTIAGAGLIGASMGAVQPSTSTDETIKNTLFGGAAGTAIPALMTGGRVAKSMVQPFYQGGREKILGNALRSAAGGQADTAATNLRNVQELVKGSAPTVGEAAGVPSLAATQRAAIAINPIATNQIAARRALQNDARLAAIEGVTPNKELAIQARNAASEPFYQAAKNKAVQITPELEELLKRNSMKSAMGRAESLANEQGQSAVFAGKPATQGLVVGENGLPLTSTPAQGAEMTGNSAHYLKMALDDMTNAAPSTGIVGNELRAIQGTKGEYLSALEKQLPEYGQARGAYAEMSKPVNQSDVLSEILRKATNFRGDVTPAAFSRSATDKTVQSVTGMKNATLDSVLNQEQSGAVKNVLADLLRSDFANTAGRDVGSNTVQNLAYTNMLDKAGVPNMVRNFAPAGAVGNLAQRAGQMVYKDANERLSSELAEVMLDPKKAAMLMDAAKTSPQLQMLIDGLRRGSASVGAATPALIQANQE